MTLLFAYQNCGRIGFQAQRFGADLSSLGVCEALLKDAFKQTYFPMLSARNKCNQCHSEAHGSTNVDVSFRHFMEKGVTTIDRKATQPHGDNGLNLSSEIASFKGTWNQAESDYSSCMQSGSGSGLKLKPKNFPQLDTTRNNQNAWQTVEWDLETESEDAEIAALFKVEARLQMRSGEVAGIDFRNPSMKLKDGAPSIKVSGLKLFLDSVEQEDFTAYIGLSKVIESATDSLLIDQNAIAPVFFPEASSATLVSFEFTRIAETTETETPPPAEIPKDPPAGTPVTFTQLTSTDPVLGVFRAQCFSCHSGATIRGNLDLSNYQDAAARSGEIVRRMFSTATPMPPTGVLPQDVRDIVLRWTNNGTPQ